MEHAIPQSLRYMQNVKIYFHVLQIIQVLVNDYFQIKSASHAENIEYYPCRTYSANFDEYLLPSKSSLYAVHGN